MASKLPMDYYVQKADELNRLFNGYLDKVSQDKGITKEEAYQEFVVMIHDSAPRAPTIDSDRVSTKPTTDSERVQEVPRVATLRQQATDVSSLEDLMSDVSLVDRHRVKSFKGLPTQKGVEAMDFMIRSGDLSKKEIAAIHDFLITNPTAQENFLRLYGDSPDAQNRQFELFLSIMDLDILNTKGQDLLLNILDFAFSPTRFEWIQLQDTDINPTLHKQLLKYEASIRSRDIHQEISQFESRSPQAHRSWIGVRMSGSTTITTSSSVQRDATESWIAADKKMATKASAPGMVSFNTVRVIHKTLTAKDSDVDNPGEVRNRRAKSSLAHQEYPTHRHDLREKAISYGAWLNGQMEACARGEKSVILTAAQAYQRLVSIHPFENGNGRISRLMMDFVLERFNLPPAALGKDVLDAVYTLDQKKPGAGEAFVRKVQQGVEESRKAIRGQ